MSFVKGARAALAAPAQAETADEGGLLQQLHKTRFCVYYMKGTCFFGAECSFAHSKDELKGMPDLRKTRLCVAYKKGRCAEPDCKYAHGENQLVQVSMFHKRALCIWFDKGKCRNGESCCFAHGVGELRGAPRGANSDSTPSELDDELDSFDINSNGCTDDSDAGCMSEATAPACPPGLSALPDLLGGSPAVLPVPPGLSGPRALASAPALAMEPMKVQGVFSLGPPPPTSTIGAPRWGQRRPDLAELTAVPLHEDMTASRPLPATRPLRHATPAKPPGRW